MHLRLKIFPDLYLQQGQRYQAVEILALAFSSWHPQHESTNPQTLVKPVVWYESLTTKTNIGRSDRREPEDWGGASGRPPHTSVSLHLDSEERAPPASRHLMRRRTQDTLVAVAPSQNALSGDAATPCGTPAHLHVCLFPLCIAYVCSFLVTPYVSSLHQVGFPLEPPLVQQQSASNGQEEGEGETTE